MISDLRASIAGLKLLIDDFPPLNQSRPHVRFELKSWVRNLVSTYGFDSIIIYTDFEYSWDFWGVLDEF